MSGRAAAFEAALAHALKQGRLFEASLAALRAYPDLLAERYDWRHWGTETDHTDEEERLKAVIGAVYDVLRAASPEPDTADVRRVTTEIMEIIDGPERPR